jgi:hypothetical protein
MYIIELRFEGIMKNIVFDTKEQAIQYIKDYEEEEYENTKIEIVENKIMGKYDVYNIIKLERWKD